MVDRLHEPYRAEGLSPAPAPGRGGAIGRRDRGLPVRRRLDVLAFSDSVRTISRIEGAFGAAAADTDLDGRIAVVSPRNVGAHVGQPA